jgi:transposase
MDRAALAALDREALVEVVLRLVAEQTARVAALETRVAALERENAELKARLGRDSRNSSRPPSSDPPGSRPRPRGEPGARRPGGQPGHPGRHRPLLPPEQVDRLVVLRPGRCAGCGAPLAAESAAEDPAVERIQVSEVPPLAVQVTEYRLEARRCGCCGRVTRAERPAEAGAGRFGPRLQALVAVLSGRYRLSRREVVQVLADLWGVELALGTVIELEQATSAALGPVVDEALVAAQQTKAANLDETGWHEGRQRAWLWVLVTAWLTIFRIAPRRAGAVARELLGPAWRGIVTSDRFSGYAWLPVPWRQVCWAHLKRDFQALVDRGGTAAAIGEAALAIEREVFALWHRFRQGELDRAALRRELDPLQARLWRVFADGVASDDAKAAALCWELGSRLWPSLWSFARYEGVEPTNNAAERALRPAVLWRKGSFGCHSPAGSRFAERMLTVTATCRQQGRDLVEFLVQANRAARLGTPPPSLLPAHAA